MAAGLVAMGAAALFGLTEAPRGETIPLLLVDSAREARAGVALRTAPVVLGDVTTRVSPTHLQDPVSILRDYLKTELGAIDWTKRHIKGRYTLVAALVRLESSTSKSGLVSSCTVATAVHDSKHGLLLTIDGKAQVEGAPSAGSGAEREALAAAVHSSMGSLPDAIARAQ